MNMRSRGAILIVGASLAATGHTSWAGSEHEFSKDGHSYKYVWRQYLDAQIVRPRPGREVRVLALRSGLLQQKASNQFLDLRKVVGLWQATLDPEGRIAQNEMVLDLTTRLLEQHKLVLVPPATLNARMMSACPDALGQIHVFVALPVWNDKSDFQNRLFYLREKQNNWKELITGPQSSFFPYLTAFSAGDSVQVYYLQNVKDPDPPPPPALPSGQPANGRQAVALVHQPRPLSHPRVRFHRLRLGEGPHCCLSREGQHGPEPGAMAGEPPELGRPQERVQSPDWRRPGW